MKWNVYIYNINQKKIEPFNIFDHWRFVEDVKKDIKKYKNKDEFADKLKSELMYFFWSKAEYEIIIAPWCGGDRGRDSIKIDVFDQVMMNWDVFVDYVWKNRKEISKL